MGMLLAALLTSSEQFALTFSTSISANVLDPQDAGAGLRFNVDGSCDKRAGTVGSAFAADGGWWEDSTPPTAHVRATVNSGSLTSGTTGSWLSLASAQTFLREQTTVGTSSANVTFDFSLDGGASIHASATVAFSALVDV